MKISTQVSEVIQVFIDVENTLNVPFITGIQRVTRKVCKLLCEPGFSRTFEFLPVLYDAKKQSWRLLSRQEKIELYSSKPRSMNLAHRLTRKLRALIPLSRQLYVEISNPDKLFLDIDSSWHSSFPREKLLPILRANGVTTVKVHYDIIPIKYPETTHSETIGIFQRHFDSHLMHSQLFLNISDKTQGDLLEYCDRKQLNRPACKVIRIGSDASKNQVNLNLANQDSPYGQFILCVGTIEPRKNHMTLLKAFSNLQSKTQLNLVIVGKTGWSSEEVLNLLQDKQYTKNRIFYLGSQPDEKLDELYRKAWLCVVPSIYEGFGLPVVEALIRGCATVSSTGGSLAEVAPNATEKFSPTSYVELEQLILKLVESDDAYQVLKSKAENFEPTSWETTARDIDDSLLSVLNS